MLLVFREVIKTLRELAIVDLPKGPSGEGKLQKLAKSGVRVVFAALVDAGASAVVGQILDLGAKVGAKKTAKKAGKKAAKKAAKRGSAP